MSGFKNKRPKATAAVEEPVSVPSSGFIERSSRSTSPIPLISAIMSPSPSVKMSPILPRGPSISPAAFTTASFITSPPTKLPSASKRGILRGFPFTFMFTGILRSSQVPLPGAVVITIGKGRVGGPI